MRRRRRRRRSWNEQQQKEEEKMEQQHEVEETVEQSRHVFATSKFKIRRYSVTRCDAKTKRNKKMMIMRMAVYMCISPPRTATRRPGFSLFV